jgi:hypothetical protein
MNVAIRIVPGRIKNVNIFGAETGEIGTTKVENAIGKFTIRWDTVKGNSVIITQDLSPKYNLGAGVYRITITDSGGRVARYNYEILQNQLLRIYPAKVEDVFIYGQSTGSIGLTQVTGGNGAYTIYWESDSTPVPSHDLRPKRNLAAGHYTVTVKDGVGAEASYMYVILQSNKLQIHFGKIKNAPISGRGGGYISQSYVTGGVSPYSFTWSSMDGGSKIPIQVKMNRYDIDTVSTKDDLKPGKYILTVTDQAGASVTHAFKISEGPTRIYFEGGHHYNFFHVSD